MVGGGGRGEEDEFEEEFTAQKEEKDRKLFLWH